MAKFKRLLKSITGLVLPIILFFCVSVVAASVWLVYKSAEPPRSSYLVTPAQYGQLSARGSQVTDETWTNSDGSTARGWLLRGSPNAPAVILFHGYGTDRSYVLNLGVKLNEATDFTVLMPDLRGHGENPTIANTTFGGCETEDAVSAIKYLRELKNGDAPLVSDIGIFGIELGALVGLSVAAQDEGVKALVLDSVPAESNEVLDLAVERRFPFAGVITSKLAEKGTYFYFATGGCYDRNSLCGKANSINGRKVLLLAGSDEPELQDSTTKISRCFPNSTVVETKMDFNLSGYGIMKASLEQADAYDQKVIEFFKRNLETLP